MVMSARTAQSIYLMMAGTLCAIVAAGVACLIAAIFHFGDGEGVHIISDMTPVVLGSITAFMGVFTAHAAPAIITAIKTTPASPAASGPTVSASPAADENGAPTTTAPQVSPTLLASPAAPTMGG